MHTLDGWNRQTHLMSFSTFVAIFVWCIYVEGVLSTVVHAFILIRDFFVPFLSAFMAREILFKVTIIKFWSHLRPAEMFKPNNHE